MFVTPGSSKSSALIDPYNLSAWNKSKLNLNLSLGLTVKSKYAVVCAVSPTFASSK